MIRFNDIQAVIYFLLKIQKNTQSLVINTFPSVLGGWCLGPQVK